jgi:DNA-directed RNA polymerase II subunit RPB1
MANLYFAKSSAPLKTVKEIQFGTLSPEDIKNFSVVHVVYPETMDETRTKPRDGGLNDPLMGSIDRQYKCKSCTNNMSECQGHFGHIELAKPVYHPGFIKKVKKVLEVVCHNCSKVLADRVSHGSLMTMQSLSPW